MYKEFFENLSTSALIYRLLDIIASRGGIKSIALEDLHISRLVNKMRLMWDYDTYTLIAFLKRSKSSGAGFITGKFSELLDKQARWRM